MRSVEVVEVYIPVLYASSQRYSTFEYTCPRMATEICHSDMLIGRPSRMYLYPPLVHFWYKAGLEYVIADL